MSGAFPGALGGRHGAGRASGYQVRTSLSSGPMSPHGKLPPYPLESRAWGGKGVPGLCPVSIPAPKPTRHETRDCGLNMESVPCMTRKEEGGKPGCEARRAALLCTQRTPGAAGRGGHLGLACSDEARPSYVSHALPPTCHRVEVIKDPCQPRAGSPRPPHAASHMWAQARQPGSPAS